MVRVCLAGAQIELDNEPRLQAGDSRFEGESARSFPTVVCTRSCLQFGAASVGTALLVGEGVKE